MSKIPERLRFVYEKATHHRSFRADGAWASTTPKGDVQVAFFNDLRPLPAEVVHGVRPDGLLGDEISQQGAPEEVLRETNVTVVMDRETTKSLIALLGRILAALEGADAEREVRQAGDSVRELKPK